MENYMFSKINVFSFKAFGIVMIVSSFLSFYVQLNSYTHLTQILNLFTINAANLFSYDVGEKYGILISSLINVFQLFIGFYFFLNKKTDTLFYTMIYLLLASFIFFGVFVMNDVCYIMDDAGVFNCSLGVVRPILLMMSIPLLMYICLYQQVKKAT